MVPFFQAACAAGRSSARLLRPARNDLPHRLWWHGGRMVASEVNPGCGSEVSVGGASGRNVHVAVGMSGGVDSSVAALILQQQGYTVTGLYMRNWDTQDELGTQECSAEQDYKDAKLVCKELGIDLIHVDYHRRYWSHVFEPLTNDYALGLTPNPDLHCNKHIKFDALLKYALEIGAEKLATGHYARVQAGEDGKAQLLRGVDGNKDQSYFLASVSGDALSHVVFPIGKHLKSEVREIAASARLSVAAKRSSAGICFVGRRDFTDFISEYVEMRAGPFICVEDGSVVGTHVGTAAYTNGQRARISGAAEPWFVVGKDMQADKVFVAQGKTHAALLCRCAVAGSLFWISGELPKPLRQGKPLECSYKARYNQDVARCTVSLTSANSPEAVSLGLGLAGAASGEFQPSAYCRLHECPPKDKDLLLQIRFEKAAKAITPGQALVLYDGDVCLGGGFFVYPGISVFEEGLAAGRVL